MVGSILSRSSASWISVLDRLKTVEILKFETDLLDYEYPSLFRALEVSIQTLPQALQDFYDDFAIFPEDVPIPKSVLDILWGKMGKNKEGVQEVLDDLVNRSLLFVSSARKYILHDLQRDYLHSRTADRILKLHQKWVDAYRQVCRGDWVNGPNDGYYFQNLPYHLDQAGEIQTLKKLLLDFDWIEKKLEISRTSGLLADYRLPGARDMGLEPIYGALKLSIPVLARDPSQLPSQILGRMGDSLLPDYQTLLQTARAWHKSTWLRPEKASLTPPNKALIHTFLGHEDAIAGALLLPDGRALSWSWDHTLRLWDLESGQPSAVLEGHTREVRGALLLPDGRALSWSADNTLRLWDLARAICQASFSAEATITVCIYDPALDRILSGDSNGRIHLLSIIDPASQ